MGTTNGHSSTHGSKEVSVERELAVKLSPEELVERGSRMSEAEIEIEGLKLRRSALTGAINVQVKKRNELGHVIDKGEEKRVVVCKWVKNFTQNCWQLMRLDTNVEVEVKPMTAGDRQAEIAFPTDEVDVGGMKVTMPGAGKDTKGKGKGRAKQAAAPKIPAQTPVVSKAKSKVTSISKGKSKRSNKPFHANA
jgi:hypothetical protein